MLGSPLHSYLLAQAFGLYFIILSIIFLSRENYYRQVLQQQPYPSFLSCSLSLFISIFLILIHNIWVFAPRVMVTIVCWAFFLRTILLISYPEYMSAWIKKICAGRGYYVGLGLMGLLGILMLTRGTMLFVALKGHPV